MRAHYRPSPPRRLLLASVLCLSACGRALAGPTVMGLELGAPLDLPPCKMKVRHGVPLPAPGQVGTCVEAPRKDTDLPVPVRTVWFAADRAPAIVVGRYVRAIEADGRLEGLQFHTAGADTQDAVLAALTDKFGTPAARDNKRVMSDAGVAQNAIIADWAPAGLHVHMEGVADHDYLGLVAIDTPAGLAQRRAWTGVRGDERQKL